MKNVFVGPRFRRRRQCLPTIDESGYSPVQKCVWDETRPSLSDDIKTAYANAVAKKDS